MSTNMVLVLRFAVSAGFPTALAAMAWVTRETKTPARRTKTFSRPAFPISLKTGQAAA